MNKISKLLLTAGLTAGTILATPGCSGKPVEPIKTVRLGYNPVQCEDTPWESARHDVINFYADQGIEIVDTSMTRYLPTCAACYVCPRGYTLIAEVAADDAQVLLDDGFFNYNLKGR